MEARLFRAASRHVRDFCLALAAVLAGVACGRAADFEVPLGVRNAHLLEVRLGCNARGTDGYDRGLDDLAPPPGIETGFVGFIAPSRMPFFYKDIRGPVGPHEWRLRIGVFRDREVELRWKAADLPEGWEFTITTPEGVQNMRAGTDIRLAESATLVIRGARTTPGNPQTPAPEASRNTP